MRFLYKIWSGYDGFRPRVIPNRADARGRLTLGWHHYIDVLERGAEVWVFFHGPHAFTPGVYVKGFVQEIDPAENRVLLRMREWSTDEPLADDATNAVVADAVAQRGRQVFYLPQTLIPTPTCNIQNCAIRQCDNCARWAHLPVVADGTYAWPSRLPGTLTDFVPGYWVVPTRSFVYRLSRRVSRGIRETTDLFYQFKAGEERLAYPLARGIYEALRRRGTLDFDAIVPVPLSPDKAQELHRTRALARELGGLLGIRVVEALSLRQPVSKRRLRNQGWSAPEFERHYLGLLDVAPHMIRHTNVLLIDDVCDHGSTLRCASVRLRQAHPAIQVTAVAAGQMVIREAVRDESVLVE